MKVYPKVSVIVSTYNRGKTFLPLALQSILDQNYSDYEVIVADDASTDCTPEVIERFYKKFKGKDIEFRAFRLAKNSGYQCVPKNMAIYSARGDYIAYLDDDNEWHPNHLKHIMKVFDNEVELDLVYCWRKYIGSNDKGVDPEPHPPEWPMVAGNLMQFINLVDTSDIVHSRGIAYALYDKFECIWDDNDRRFGDLTLLRRMVQAGVKAKLLPEELTTYRWHGNNLMLVRPVSPVVATSIDKVLECESESIQ